MQTEQHPSGATTAFLGGQDKTGQERFVQLSLPSEHEHFTQGSKRREVVLPSATGRPSNQHPVGENSKRKLCVNVSGRSISRWKHTRRNLKCAVKPRTLHKFRFNFAFTLSKRTYLRAKRMLSIIIYSI